MWHRLLIALTCVIAGRVETTATPTYQFTVGEELTYKLVAKEDLLATPHAKLTPLDRELSVAVLPVRQNSNGAWRLLLRTRVRLLDLEKTNAGGEPAVRFANETLGWCDLTPDGGYVTNPTLRDNIFYGAVPEWTLPPLPTNNLRMGRRAAASGQSYVLQRMSRSRLAGQITTPIDARYDNRRRLTIDFDDGRPTRLITESTGGDADDRFHNRREVALVGTRQLTASQVAAYDAAADRYFVALEAWWVAMEQSWLSADPDDCQQALEAVAALINASRAAESHPEFASLYDALLATHSREAESVIAEVKERARVREQPPLDWVTTTLAGEPRRRADYDDRVVLLDFWYRGCQSCIEALPMIKRLRERYAKRPVSILGINKDHNPSDAQHVINVFGIDYETLNNKLSEPLVLAGATLDNGKSTMQMSDAYGVRGWPTFVVLDQQGRVAAIEYGFLDNSEQRLASVIDSLLDDE